MKDLSYVLIQMAVMALVTYLVRMLPMTLLTKKITNRFFRSFLYYVPYAVLGAMTFPTVFFSAGGLIPGLVGTAVALVLAFFRRSLLTVAASACCAVYAADLLMRLL